MSAKNNLNPDQLVEKMELCTYDFEEANRKLRKLEEEHNKTQREKDIGTILACKRPDLLTNPIAKERYEICCADEKFKPTKDIIDDFTALELGHIGSEFFKNEMIAKQAQKEYEMWQGQLFKYQSELKARSAEMMSLGSQPG